MKNKNVLESDKALEALDIINENPMLTQREISKKVNISLGKTHYLIKSFIDVGWIKFNSFKKSNEKWGYRYILTPKGVSEKAKLTISFISRKEKEYKELKILLKKLRNNN